MRGAQHPQRDISTPDVTDAAPLLEVRGLTKRYPGVLALDDVDLSLRRHEVLGLVGQNGSGKTTLLKIIAGLVRPDSGTVVLRGRSLVAGDLRAARAAGIAMVYQEQSLLPGLTVAENIALGAEGSCSRLRGLYPWGAIRRTAAAQLERLDADISVRTPVERLSQGERQTVELAKALMCEVTARDSDVILLLDEPTSTLSQREIKRLFREVERLRERSSVIFVSHRLEEVLAIADRVYVLRDGRSVAERTRGDWEVGEFFSLMTGQEQSADYYDVNSQVALKNPVARLEANSLTSAGSFSAVSFTLHAGEVLGICGVEGSGREKLMRALFGAERIDDGWVLLEGSRVRLRSPARRSSKGWDTCRPRGQQTLP